MFQQLEDEVPVQASKKKKEASEGNEEGLKGFQSGAHWEPLTADELSVEEPHNPSFKKPHAPTVPKEDAGHVPVKFNFLNYLFTIPVFTGLCKIISRYSNGTAKKNKDGSNKFDTVQREFG